MASELTLEINGRKRDILRYNYRFHREIRYNRPVDSIWGGEICVEMTSDGDTYFLEMLMAEKEVIKEINDTRKTFTVPAAVSGKIQFIKENEIFRELSFQEAYVVFYGERMSSIGPKSMSTFLVISPMKMEVNKRVMMVKRQDTGINLGWVQKVEENPKPTPVAPYTPPTLLVRTAAGETEALPNDVIEYKVTSYNLPNVSDSDRKRVKWDIEVDGKRKTLNVKGETINLTIKEEWGNKELVVMPYLKKATTKVSVKTQINKWYIPRVIIQTKTKEGFGDKKNRNIYEYEDAYGNGLTEASTQIAIDMHWGNEQVHTNNFTLNQITDKNVLSNIQRLNQKSDKELFSIFKELIKCTSRGELEQQNLNLVHHLEQRINTEYENNILTENVFLRKSTNEFVNNIKQGVIQEIKNKSGNLNIANFGNSIKDVKRPIFSIKEDKLRGLTIAIHDIWGFRVSMEEYSFDPNKQECVAKIKYRIFDHFGLDSDDIIGYGSKEKIMKKMGILGLLIEEITTPHPSQGLPIPKTGMGQAIAEEVADGFCAWFILQHLRGYKPFVTVMEKTEMIKFNI